MFCSKYTMLGFAKRNSKFDPRSIPGCALWLDGADSNSMTFSSGSNISTWVDKSPNGYIGTSSGSPTFVTNSQNGLPVVNFVASSSQYFNFGNILPQTQMAVFFVGKTTFVNGTTQGFIVRTAAAFQEGRWGLYWENNNTLFFFIQTAGANYIASNAATSYSGTFSLFEGGWDGTSTFLYGNGTQLASVSASVTATSNADVLLVGAYNNASGGVPPASGCYYNGTIGEIIMFSNAITTGQRQSIEGYLAWKWGIQVQVPTTHPFYSTPAFSRPFSPVDIAGCALWLDAADTTTITGGSAVTAWNDKSGNGVNAASPIGTITTNSTPINKLNTIRFGTTSYLTIPSLTLTTNITAFAVLRGVTTHGTGPAGYFFLGRGNQPSFFTYTTGSGSFSALFASGNETDWSLPSSNYFYNNPGIVCVTNNASYVNGTQLTLLSGSVPNNITAGTYTSLLVGGRGSGFTDSVAFDYAELIVYNTSLTTSQRQQVEGYLAAKWGLRSSIVSGHPFKSIPPCVSLPPQFSEVTPGRWTYDWQPYLNKLASVNSSGVTVTTSNITGGATFITSLGGCLAPNGNIYFGQFDGGSMLVLNPTTGVTSNLTGGATYTSSGWIGGVLAPNGNIYFAPHAATNILVLNPTTGVTSNLTGGATYTTPSGWTGGVLAPNGNIYFTPFNATNILVLNPTTGVTSNLTGGATYTTPYGWIGGVLAPNGNIYFAPFNATNILVLNPTTGVTSNLTGGATFPGNNAWAGGVLGPNGNIYFTPHNATNILVLNPTTGVTSNLTGGATFPGSSSWYTGILAPNGNIYFSPRGATNILKLTFSGLSQTPSLTYCLSAWTNKY